MRKLLLMTLAVLVAIYIGLLGLLFFKQRALIYHVDAQRLDIAAANLPGLEERLLKTVDGETLIAWHVPPRGEQPVLLYFQGNAATLSHPDRVYAFRQMMAEGAGLFAVSYRGYGGSTGTPTEKGLRLDAQALYQEAAKLYGASRLIAYGHSLGTGVAVRLASERLLKALILEAPFTSTAAIAQSQYWYVPVKLLMLDQFRSDELVGKLSLPILIMHGDKDTIIPIEYGRQLYELASQPKYFVTFEQGGHNDLYQQGAAKHVLNFVRDIQAGKFSGAIKGAIK